MSAAERKLSPVYDLLEAGKVKEALKAAEAVWKKHPESGTAAALRAYLLQRCGRPAEALVAAEELARRTPTDEQVLSTLTLVWRACGRPELSSAAYESAAAARPADHALLAAAFFAHLRSGELALQQRAAQRVYRAQPTERHLLWVVAALLAQARRAEAEARAPQLALAEGLLRRQAERSSFQHPSALQLYVDALGAQGRHAEALQTARGPLAASPAWLPRDALRLRLRLAKAAADWPAAEEAALQLLAENCDDWLAFLAACEAAEARAGGARQGAEAVAALAARLRAEAQAAGGPRVVGRGPWLAGVEAARRALAAAGEAAEAAEAEEAEAEAEADALADAVAAHFAAFSGAPSCASDLGRYAAALRPHAPAAARLAAALAPALGGPDGPASAEALRAAAAAAALLADAGCLHAPLSAASEIAPGPMAASLLASARRLGPELVRVTDLREGTGGDGAFLIAAEACGLSALAPVAGPDATGPRTEALLCALLVACEGLAGSPFSAPLRLAAAAAYSLLGAGGAAAASLARLQPRHVQHESLAHLIQPPLLCSGDWAGAARAAAALRALHGGQEEGGAGEMAAAAAVAGGAEHLLQFLDFSERLARGHARAASEVEAGLAAAAGGAAGAAAAARARPLAQPAALARLRHNADSRCLPRFLPPPRAGWHAAVADWWAEAEGASLHAWPRRAVAEEEGDGAAARARAAAALAARWALLGGVDAAQRFAAGDAGAREELAGLAGSSAASSAAAAAGGLRECDAAGDAALQAAAALAAAADGAPGGGARAADAMRGFAAAAEAACAGARARLAAGRYPQGGAALGGGAVNAAAAAAQAAQLGAVYVAAWAALPPKRWPREGGAREAAAEAARRLAAAAAGLAGALDELCAEGAQAQAEALGAALRRLPSLEPRLAEAVGEGPRAVREEVVAALLACHRDSAARLAAQGWAAAKAAEGLAGRLGAA